MEQNSTPLFFNFRTWLKAFVLTMTLLVPVMVQAQTTIFRETMGNDGSSSIAAYEASGFFDNDDLTMSGSALVSIADPSSGYTGATGNSYIEMNGPTSEKEFIIAGINTINYSSIGLSFGMYNGRFSSLVVDFSINNGGSWTTITLGTLPANNNWGIVSDAGLVVIPESSNLSLRFRHTGTRATIGIDDVKLSGVYTAPTPTIYSFSPEAAGVGATVTVTGANLLNTAYVYFTDDGFRDAEASDVTSTSFKFIVPNGAKTSRLELWDEFGETLVISDNPFTVIAPAITNIAPKEGFVGDTIKIYGTNLSTASSVTFGGGGSVIPTIVGDGEIKVKVPATAKSGAVQVITSYGTATSDINNRFTVLVPTIAGFTPSQGSPKPAGVQGDEITISGNYLMSASSVVFGGAGSAIPHFTSETSIRVYVPDDAETGTLSVVTAKGTAISSTSFTVLKPKITSLSKNNGKVGETIYITGERLNVAPFTVTFGKLTATVTSNSSTQLAVTVPSGAESGVVTVTTAEGTAVTSSSFSVVKPTFIVQNTPLDPFTTKAGVPSEPQFYAIVGSNLEGSLNIAAPSQFELSGDEGASWTTEGLSYIPDANGTVTQKNIFVRYNPSAQGTHSGNITNASVNLTELIAVQGATLDPTITVTGTFSEFMTDVNTPSASQSYTVSGTHLESGITVAGPASGEFKVSLDNTTFTRTVSVPLDAGSTSIGETPIYVRYEPTESGSHSGSITHSSLNATDVTLAVSGSTSKSSLPVELISFKAEQQANEVTLLWATASEKDNSHFEVEMSVSPDAGFTRIGKVKSKTGNSSVTTNYLLKYSLTEAGTHYFRLKQVDLDGSFAYSKVVAVEAESAAFAENGVYVAPNPLNYNSKVFVVANAGGKASLVLHSMAGRQVYQKTVEVNKGRNDIQLPLYDKLPAGLYILTVELEGQRHQLKVVKQ